VGLHTTNYNTNYASASEATALWRYRSFIIIIIIIIITTKLMIIRTFVAEVKQFTFFAIQ